jgi:hypothetical protein
VVVVSSEGPSQAASRPGVAAAMASPAIMAAVASVAAVTMMANDLGMAQQQQVRLQCRAWHAGSCELCCCVGAVCTAHQVLPAQDHANVMACNTVQAQSCAG